MRAHRVVFNSPTFQNLLGLCQRIEQPGIQHFLSNAAVKPLNKCILVRLTRLDIAQFNPVPLSPADLSGFFKPTSFRDTGSVS